MEDPGCPRRRRPARMLGWMLAASVVSCLGAPAVIQPRWQVTYPPQANGKAAESAAVSINGASMVVAVVAPGADAGRAAVRVGNRKLSAVLIGHDPVSSLAFLKVEGDPAPIPMKWRDDAAGCVGTPLQALIPGENPKCRATGWIKQVGTKILPLALLEVTFDQKVPSPGTPLLDPQGRIVAVLFQASGKTKVGYAIPAEAVHRVGRDLLKGGPLVRGWLGLSLLAETKVPRVVKVLPHSPAATAGVQPADILLSVGSRNIADYADAANAFFYLIPGEPVRVRLKRGNMPLELTITPTRPQGD
jgi:S1-C subfamily serine protease